MSGTLYGIGVGPGDPDLITMKAYKALQSSNVIAYPAPEVGDSLARSIAAPHIPDSCREIVVRIPLDPKHYDDRTAYDRAAVEIAEILRSGEDVSVICEGDPFFYGSFMYLFNRLSEDFNVEIIPGISSLMACAGASLTPLVARNEVLSVLPAPMAEEKLREQLSQTDAAAIIKLGRHAPKVYGVLRDLGLLDHAHYVEHATMKNQQVRRLQDVDPTEVPYFAMILVRKDGVGK
ncbi:MAG: precorrin-2 C(20)-methyltransferase [Rhodospirillales bacterium]|mgnify:CR=1 FL=1|jgi:precorrin-2/cobalt-factor-2 C20-methyltransferase|nr:precorrin-2 C(20)-methyltransferase [Rhodospirillales bacterium]